MNNSDISTEKNIAVVGGGLLGLSAAYAMVQPMQGAGKPAITVYDQGSAASYFQPENTGHRASQGASAARCIRLSGASKGLGAWNVRQTVDMLNAVQADVEANPEDYPAYDGNPLL